MTARGFHPVEIDPAPMEGLLVTLAVFWGLAAMAVVAVIVLVVVVVRLRRRVAALEGSRAVDER